MNKNTNQNDLQLIKIIREVSYLMTNERQEE